MQRLILYENERLTHFVTDIHKMMRGYGYEHVQVPAIELSDVFLNRAGDQIIANLFTFERFGRQLALRPEFTSLAAHRYAANYPQGEATIRWQFNGSIFRDDYQQRDTSYQHMSVGAELFGLHNRQYADAEITSLAAHGIFTTAALQDVHLKIGHVGLIRTILAQYALDERTERYLLDHITGLASEETSPAQIIAQFEEEMIFGASTDATPTVTPTVLEQGTHRMLDVMLNANQRGTTMGGRSREDIVRRLLKKRKRSTQREQLVQALDHLYRWVLVDGDAATVLPALRQLLPEQDVRAHMLFEEWTKTLDLIERMGVDSKNIRIAPGLVRNWNYYTGIVFEFRGEQNNYYGGGGRYDELVRLMGAKIDVPAIGFAYDVDMILSQMREGEKQDFAAIPFAISDVQTAQAIPWFNLLREQGVPFVVINEQDATTSTLRLTDNGDLRYLGDDYALDAASKLVKAITK